MLIALRMGLVISALPVVVALIMASVPTVGGAPMMVDPACDVFLQTDTTTRTSGVEFDVNIVVSAGTDVPVSAIQTFLNFDTEVLEVVDLEHASGPIMPGDVFVEPLGPIDPEGTWTKVLKNSMDNTTTPGQADFVGGKGTEESSVDVTEEFVLATVRFKAIAASPGTEISFNDSDLRQTKVMSGVDVVTGQLSGVTIVVEEPIELVDVTFDNITLQGRDANDPVWTMPMVVEFYNSDTQELMHGFTPTAEGGLGNSMASFQVSGVEPGIYDIWVKGENTLSKLLEDQEIAPIPEPIALGVQTGGDATSDENGPPDNIIDIDDYDALLAAIFSETASLSAEQQLNDHTRSGVIDVSDYSIVVNNLELTGITLPSP